MSELNRKDDSLQRESQTPNANAPATDPGSRPLVTPPPSTSPASPQPQSATSRAGTAAGAAPAMAEEKAPLFAANESSNLRSQWDSVQVTFVDDPRNAVQRADALVSETIKRLSEVFTSERQKLEEQWGRGADASTEDLRVALRRYRSFFTRLLEI
ncbi:MAG TPA: hypothetical protein VN788_17160 [Verrucomicrobiae bacterium]|nr:hypothetical protein [Verrucomicrobiae bacterium]